MVPTNLREFRVFIGGSCAATWWAWVFAGDAIRGTINVVLYLLVLGVAESVAYLRRTKPKPTDREVVDRWRAEEPREEWPKY